jgi:hypothetical protein
MGNGKLQDSCGGSGVTWGARKPGGREGSGANVGWLQHRGGGETKRSGVGSSANVGRLVHGGGGEPKPDGGGEPKPGGGGDERIGSNLGWTEHVDEGGGGITVCGRGGDGGGGGGVGDRAHSGGGDGGGCQIPPSSRSSSFTFDAARRGYAEPRVRLDRGRRTASESTWSAGGGMGSSGAGGSSPKPA